MLYQSLHEKLLNLPDDTEIFPAHGAGSLCGRQMGSERSSTIGKERRTNYALQARSLRGVHPSAHRQPSAPARVFRPRSGAEPARRRGARSASAAGAGARAGSLPPAIGGRDRARYASGHAVRRGARSRAPCTSRSPGNTLPGPRASWASTSASSWSERTRIICASRSCAWPASALRTCTPTWKTESRAGFTGGYELEYIPQISVQEFAELREQEKGPHRRARRAGARGSRSRRDGELDSDSAGAADRANRGTGPRANCWWCIAKADIAVPSPPAFCAARGSATSPISPAGSTRGKRWGRPHKIRTHLLRMALTLLKARSNISI